MEDKHADTGKVKSTDPFPLASESKKKTFLGYFLKTL